MLLGPQVDIYRRCSGISLLVAFQEVGEILCTFEQSCKRDRMQPKCAVIVNLRTKSDPTVPSGALIEIVDGYAFRHGLGY